MHHQQQQESVGNSSLMAYFAEHPPMDGEIDVDVMLDEQALEDHANGAVVNTSGAGGDTVDRGGKRRELPPMFSGMDGGGQPVSPRVC